MTKIESSLRDTSNDVWERIEEAVAAFEEAHRTDGQADPARFAPPADDSAYLPVVRELLRADLEFAWADGQPKSIEEYRQPFPRVFADTESLRAICFEEYRLRAQAGQSVETTEYATRYGVDVTGWDGKNPSVRTHATSVFAPSIVRALFTDSPEKADDTDLSDQLFAHPDRFPEAGEIFVGFRLVRELGRGAFARVFLAEQTDMAGRYVALKISAQLLKESQTLARLQHTNIVPIYSTHTRGRFTGICMPYFGSTTLADVLQHMHKQSTLPASAEGILSTVAERKASVTTQTHDDELNPTDEELPKLSPNTAVTPLDHLRHLSHTEAVLWIGAELAEGMAFSHDRGIIHRDLKPANVLIADDGRPMLLDFNLAITPTDGKQTHAGGTPSHMSPEQLESLAGHAKIIDERSDIYSFGLILYELLTGTLPTPVGNGHFKERIEKLRQDRSVPVTSARQHNRSISPAVDAILQKCLQPDPALRYRSAQHLSEDIRRQLNHFPLLHTPEPSLRERIQKKLRRNPWLKSLPFLTAVVAFAVIATAGALWTASRERERSNAVEQYQSFRTKAAIARTRLSVPDPDPTRWAKDATAARELLSNYGLPAATDWYNSPSIRTLDRESQTQLRESVSDLIVFVAHAEASLAAGKNELERAAEHLKWNALALDAAPDEQRQWIAARQRVALYERAKQPDAAKAAQASLGPPPPGVYATMYRFTEAYERNDHRGALAILRDSESSAASRPDYWLARGRAHAELGEHADAVSAYTTALALQPEDSYRLFVHRGLAYFEVRNYAAAVRDFDSALELRDDESTDYVNRALARFRNKDNTGALADLARALELDPGHTRCYFIRQQVKLSMGDRDGAAKDLTEGLKQTPQDEISWVTRGVTKLGQRDAVGAVADFDEALKLNPTSKRALQNKASALSENLQKPAEAIRVLDELVKHHPDYTNARAGRGVLLARQGQRLAAHADAVETLKRDSAAFTKYQVAGIYALTSKTHPEDRTEALRLLAQAFKAGADPRLEKGDHDLDPLRNEATYRKLVDAVRLLEDLTGR